MTPDPPPSLVRRIEAELDSPVPAMAAELARALVDRHGAAARAVLLYGACLRSGRAEGLVDLYVLTDDYRRFHGGVAAAALNRLLPPTVGFFRPRADGPAAKVAVISEAQFRARMRPLGRDTTLWARFCQPAVLAYARDEAARRAAAESLARAVMAAAWWALRLGPAEGRPEDYWTALFRHSYAAELRVEGSGRAAGLYAHDPARYDAVLGDALDALGALPAADGLIRPALEPSEAARARRLWRARRRAGKGLNLVRLAKAAFTFDNAADYAAFKVERHSGRPLSLGPWQRRHPVLAAPLVLWRLRREGRLR